MHSIAQQPLQSEDSDNEVIGRGFCFSAKPRRPSAQSEQPGSSLEAKQAVHSQAGSALQPAQASQQAAVRIFANGSYLSDPEARSMNSASRKRQKLGNGRASSGQRRSHSSRPSATLPVRPLIDVPRCITGNLTSDANASEHIKHNDMHTCKRSCRVMSAFMLRGHLLGLAGRASASGSFRGCGSAQVRVCEEKHLARLPCKTQTPAER